MSLLKGFCSPGMTIAVSVCCLALQDTAIEEVYCFNLYNDWLFKSRILMQFEFFTFLALTQKMLFFLSSFFNSLQLGRRRTVSDKVNPSKSINVVFLASLYYKPGCPPFKGHIWHNRQCSVTSAGILQFSISKISTGLEPEFADVIHQQKLYVNDCPNRDL